MARANALDKMFVGKTFRIFAWTMIGIVVRWIVAFFTANVFQCTPISANWANWDEPGICIDTTEMYLAQAWSDIFTDGAYNFAVLLSVSVLTEAQS